MNVCVLAINAVCAGGLFFCGGVVLFYYMPTKVCHWMCGACVLLYAYPKPKASEGVPWVSPYTVAKPIWAGWQQEHDCTSIWPHAQCQLCSARMEGWRPEKEILGQQGWRGGQEEQERRRMERQRGDREGGERRSWLTEYKWKQTWSDKETNKNSSRIDICT